MQNKIYVIKEQQENTTKNSKYSKIQKKKKCINFDNNCKNLNLFIEQIVSWNGFQIKIHLYDACRATFKMIQKAKMQRMHKANPK